LWRLVALQLRRRAPAIAEVPPPSKIEVQHDRKALLAQYRRLYTLWIQELSGMGSTGSPAVVQLEQQLAGITRQLSTHGVRLHTTFSVSAPAPSESR
jgi:hypothetical protein